MEVRNVAILTTRAISPARVSKCVENGTSQLLAK